MWRRRRRVIHVNFTFALTKKKFFLLQQFFFLVCIISEQVVGDSGCEDSEDEWDFIKVDKKPANLEVSTVHTIIIDSFSITL